MGSWHWVDSGCYDYAKRYISETLTGLRVVRKDVVVKVSSVEHVLGDATLCTRRGKTFGIYDLTFKFRFEARRMDNSGLVAGAVEVTDFDSAMTSKDGIRLKVIVEESAPNPVDLEDVSECLRNKLFSVLKQFNEDIVSAAESGKSAEKQPSQSSQLNQLSQSSQPLGDGSYTNLSGFSEDMFLAMDAEKAFEVHSNPEIMSCWSGGAVLEIEPRLYSAFDGKVEFQLTDCVRPKVLNMKWRLSKWRPGHYANINMLLSEMKSTIPVETKKTNSTTLVQFTASSIPKEHVEKVKDFFFKNYLEPLNTQFAQSK